MRKTDLVRHEFYLMNRYRSRSRADWQTGTKVQVLDVRYWRTRARMVNDGEGMPLTVGGQTYTLPDTMILDTRTAGTYTRPSREGVLCLVLPGSRDSYLSIVQTRHIVCTWEAHEQARKEREAEQERYNRQARERTERILATAAIIAEKGATLDVVIGRDPESSASITRRAQWIVERRHTYGADVTLTQAEVLRIIDYIDNSATIARNASERG